MTEAKKKAIEKYKNTEKGRASNLLSSYNYSDKLHNRGKGDLTSEWIVENIFSKACCHCGETDWHKLGCNRLDNSKPHTKDNVEPCCLECNNRLKDIERRKTVYQYTLENKLVRVWESAYQVQRELGFSRKGISRCCIGGCMHYGKWEKISSYKGFRWLFEPL